MKHFLLFSLVILISAPAFGQKRIFLPEEDYWHAQTLDPIESQSFGFMAAYWKGSTPADFALAAFGFGFQRAFIRWQKSDSRGYDIGVAGAAFSQFEFTHRTGVSQRNLLSTDYKIGVPFVVYLKPWTIRFRLYHLSAHMGDDYIFRHKITSYHKNNDNYEQFDVTASYLLNDFRFYFGAGAVVASAQPRKPLVVTGGINYTARLNLKGNTRFFSGFYIGSQQDHGYIPAINVGAGLQFGDSDRRPFKVLATYFVGPLPYSVYEGERVQWLGVGIYVNPF